MMCKHICSQMNVAIAAMIAGRLRSRRRDHAVTRIHDKYVGKSQSCMVISGRLIVHAPVDLHVVVRSSTGMMVVYPL